jgi:simple sugar transport system ATP-binding protein
MSIKSIVEVKNIGKSFGATRALNDVSFEFNPGEIFALVGANGAGKSTLIKIICGYYSDYEGQILVEGKEVNFSSPHDAYSNGIQTVHQIINQSVVQNMTVAENLALEELLSSEQSFFYKRQAIKDRAITIAEKMDLHFPDLDMPVGLLSQSERQMIAIARALASEPKLLILDEPTSSISDKETERLFAILVQLRKMGVAILYVSHRLHEIERIADRVGVVRDGAQGETLERPFDVKRIVTAMVGEIKKHKVLDSGTEKKYPKVKLELRNYVIEEGGSPINLKVYEGEILGITGLIGAGKSELALAMFGVTTPFSGEMFIDGQLVKPKTIAEAIQKGVFLVPEDRNNNAVIPEFTIQQNITLPFLQSFSKFGFLKVAKEKQSAKRMVESMGIKCSGEQALIESLSGGNQQKVIVARWLLMDNHVLILDEPFQGVDVKSRHDISMYLGKHSGKRATILIAADLDEVLEAADRIIVLNHGQIAGEQLADKVDRGELLHWISQAEPVSVS